MIHFVTPEYPPQHGGVADYTHHIATELSRSGERVHVWGPSGIAAPAGSAIVVHPDFGDFRRGHLRRAGTRLDAFPPPRRLVVQWVPHGYGRRAMNIAFCLWVWRRSMSGDAIDLVVHEPFVTFSGSVGQHALALVQRVMMLCLMSAARRVWVTTRAWTPLLEPFLAGAATPIQWLPVPSSLQPANPVDVSDIRARYAPGKEPLIGHFGTYGTMITPLLTDAMVSVMDAHESTKFLLIGRGSEAFRSAFAARHRPLANRVSATGTLDVDTLAAHIAACDVLLQPYPDGVTARRTTTMAGLAAGVPVVTTRGTLTEHLWQDTAPVRLAPVGEGRALAEHVIQLLADPAERRRQAESGRAFYDRWFDVGHTVTALAAS